MSQENIKIPVGPSIPLAWQRLYNSQAANDSSSVYTGSEEPTNPKVTLWLNPEAEDPNEILQYRTDNGWENIEAVSDHFRAAADHETAVLDHTQAEADHEVIENLEETLNNKANINGYYATLVVGAAKNLAGTDKILKDFVFTPIDAVDGVATVNSVRGKSLVWNQQFNDTLEPVSVSGITFERSAGQVRLYGTTTTGLYRGIIDFTHNHKYYLHFKASAYRDSDNLKYWAFYNAGSGSVQPSLDEEYKGIWTPIAQNTESKVSLTPAGNAAFATGKTVDVTAYIQAFDLTQMFGAGNEPTTVEEFEKYYPLPYYDYNAGEILNNKTESVKVTGFNQWDEEWEVGAYDNTTGAKIQAQTIIRSKNAIPLVSGQAYYIKAPSTIQFYFYDAAGNFIERKYGTGTILVPANSRQLRITTTSGYGTTYNHDICINISDPSRNGEYEPYKTNTITLNLPTITGKLNGEGESVVVFPDGMCKVGSAYDEAHGSVATKRIGKRAYQEGDESDTTVVTDGTNTLYVLATPEEYTLDTPLPETFQAYSGGTMMQLPENTSVPTTAPMVMEYTASMDAVKQIHTLRTEMDEANDSIEDLETVVGQLYQSAPNVQSGSFIEITAADYQNYRKALYLVGGAEVLPRCDAIFLNWPVPLSPLQQGIHTLFDTVLTDANVYDMDAAFAYGTSTYDEGAIVCDVYLLCTDSSKTHYYMARYTI